MNRKQVPEGTQPVQAIAARPRLNKDNTPSVNVNIFESINLEKNGTLNKITFDLSSYNVDDYEALALKYLQRSLELCRVSQTVDDYSLWIFGELTKTAVFTLKQVNTPVTKLECSIPPVYCFGGQNELT